MSNAIKATGVATTQNALSTSAELVLAANQSRTFCEVKNTDASISVYIGGVGVTTSTGHLLKPGEAFSSEDFVGALYAVAASGTPTVTTIEW